MKKFKNKIAVKGSKSLLKAFEEELLELGYISNEQWNRNYRDNKVIDHIVSNLSGKGYEYHSSKGNAQICYNLPQDWDRALELAAEVETEIPEYVKCIKTDGERFVLNHIYKVEKGSTYNSLQLLSSNGEQDCTGGYPMNGGLWSFEPSNKEKYDNQNKIKPEVGKWYKLEDYTKSLFYVTHINSISNCYGYGFIDGNWKINLIDDGVSCICNDEAFRSRAKLATDKEVEEVLVAEAKKRFPINCKFKNISGNTYRLVEDSVVYRWVPAFQSIWASNMQGQLYKNGEWAELVEIPFTIKGYDVIKLDNYTVKVGCEEFKINDLNDLYCVLDTYNMGVFKDGKGWTAGEVKSILDYCRSVV